MNKEDYCGSIRKGDEEQIQLLPGFRFHPTDEELITHYLVPKVLDSFFRALAIGEADLNRVEPWDLPMMAKMGEEEWYFFWMRDKKYPAGMRTNRATETGYWKATGKDKEIYRDKTLVGMKKTLVFYRGRAPKGLKTNWVMHEYRLEDKYSKYNLPETAKNEWVISRVFNKSLAGKKTHISALMGLNSDVDVDDEALQEPSLPPLTHSSPYNRACETKPSIGSSRLVDNIQTSSFLPNNLATSPFPFPCCSDGLQFSDSLTQDQSIFKLLLDSNGNEFLSSFATSVTAEQSQDKGLSSGGDGGGGHVNTDMSVDGSIDLDCLLNY